MNDILTTQEILLMTNTKFSAREYTDKNENQPSKNNNQNRLAEACWNGMLQVALPELFVDPKKKQCIMWQLIECDHLFYVKLGEDDGIPDAHFTLNPYLIVEISCLN